nr:MAG TPA: Myc amino-terminal region [Caudoviricetes sp.]
MLNIGQKRNFICKKRFLSLCLQQHNYAFGLRLSLLNNG